DRTAVRAGRQVQAEVRRTAGDVAAVEVDDERRIVADCQGVDAGPGLRIAVDGHRGNDIGQRRVRPDGPDAGVGVVARVGRGDVERDGAGAVGVRVEDRLAQ